MTFEDFLNFKTRDFITRDKYLSLCDSVFSLKGDYFSRFLSNRLPTDCKELCGVVGCSNKIIKYLPRDCKTVISVFEDQTINHSYGFNLFATNSSGDGITTVPIGRDWRSKDVYTDFKPKTKVNEKLIYLNFAHSTNKIRKRIYNHYSNCNWVTSVKVDKWLKYPISREQFFEDLHSHKFVFCPEGKGVDTFRLWDALYSKSIPIVLKNKHMDAFSDLPILFVDDFFSLTPQKLEEEYDKMFFKKLNLDKLNFSYWHNLVKKVS